MTEPKTKKKKTTVEEDIVSEESQVVEATVEETVTGLFKAISPTEISLVVTTLSV